MAGKRLGVTVNGNWRLTFTLEDGHAVLVDYQQLGGLIAHVHHIEPNFVARMKQKYTDEIGDAILKQHLTE